MGFRRTRVQETLRNLGGRTATPKERKTAPLGMSDGVAGVVEWGLELFEGVKKELGKACAPVEEGFNGSLNAGLSPAAPHPSDPDVKVHHTEQNEERKRAMARYGEYLLIRQKNVAKVARLGAELVARREQGFAQDSKGTREVLENLAEVREKAERDEKRLQHYEAKAYETRYTGSAAFTGDTFGRKGSSTKGDASAQERPGRDVTRGGDAVPGSGTSTRSSSAASGRSQRSQGSLSSGNSSARSTKSKGSQDGGHTSPLAGVVRHPSAPARHSSAPVVDHISSGARNLDAPPID